MTATAEKVQSEICLFGFVRMKLLFFLRNYLIILKMICRGDFIQIYRLLIKRSYVKTVCTKPHCILKDAINVGFSPQSSSEYYTNGKKLRV